MKNKIIASIFLGLFLLSLGACNILPADTETKVAIEGSGQISARETGIAPELGGKVVEILVGEGDAVQEGDILFRMDDAIYQAQYEEAVAAIGVAESAIEGAKSQLRAAQVQLEMAILGARLQEQPIRASAWLGVIPDEFTLPVWYYETDETILAAESAVEDAQAELELELEDLAQELEEASNADLVTAEEQLLKARTNYMLALQTQAQAVNANSGEVLESVAQEQLDTAEAELDRAQREYDRILTDLASEELLDARGQVAVARAYYNNALDYLDSLRTGEQSLQVVAARTAVEQAESGVAQAEANLARAKAGLRILEVQIEKTVVYAPVSGVVLTRNLEVGETIAAGGPVIIIGQLEVVKLVVYVPEDRYGEIKLGQEVAITVDSFPGEEFIGSVIHISEQAEFTPRNVQTVDSRKSTVYAVEIQVSNPEGKLKPGMPADAVVVE